MAYNTFDTATILMCSICCYVHVCQLFSWVGDARRHYMCLAVIIGLMSVEGWSNLQTQWNIVGEYQNVPTEQLMDWISEKTLHSESIIVSAACCLFVGFLCSRPTLWVSCHVVVSLAGMWHVRLCMHARICM